MPWSITYECDDIDNYLNLLSIGFPSDVANIISFIMIKLRRGLLRCEKSKNLSLVRKEAITANNLLMFYERCGIPEIFHHFKENVNIEATYCQLLVPVDSVISDYLELYVNKIMIVENLAEWLKADQREIFLKWFRRFKDEIIFIFVGKKDLLDKIEFEPKWTIEVF